MEVKQACLPVGRGAYVEMEMDPGLLAPGVLVLLRLVGLAAGSGTAALLAWLLPSRDTRFAKPCGATGGIRSTALAITFGLASALFGGTAPFVCTLLVERTGNPLGPAWYATAMTLAAAVGVALLRETEFQPLTGEDATPAG
jgi:hypothetical protein